MAKRRALTEAAKDPIVKEETTNQQRPEEKPRGVAFTLSVVAALGVGFIAGVIAKRFFRFI
jgi:hypothetical protein